MRKPWTFFPSKRTMANLNILWEYFQRCGKAKMNHLEAVIGSLSCTWAKTVQQFFRWACQPSRWMPLSFRRKGPENWACPSNQHKQSLKPLFQNPSWKGNEFGKEIGVTGAHRMLHAGYRANRILNLTERPQAANHKIRNVHARKVKRYMCTSALSLLILLYECSSNLWTLAGLIMAMGHSERFRFNKFLCLWSQWALK